MRVVPTPSSEAQPMNFVGIPLSVVFAEGEAIASIRETGSGSLALSPPFHVSDDDAYLVLPDDIGMEILDILKEGDLELVHEAMRDGLLVLGDIARKGAGQLTLEAEVAISPADALAKGLPYAHELALDDGEPLAAIESLDDLKCTVVSALLDEEGLDSVLRAEEFAGISWRVPEALAEKLAGVDPTCVWSRRQRNGIVGIECALFQEYEELVFLIRPLAFRL